mmetsp:Transcript_12842/g.26231  ORF Transcript_12842/g.26231 Transcript_12842/m.26231 type:complete len:202 (+) Transcript_12842:55-660(+)
MAPWTHHAKNSPAFSSRTASRAAGSCAGKTATPSTSLGSKEKRQGIATTASLRRKASQEDTSKKGGLARARSFAWEVSIALASWWSLRAAMVSPPPVICLNFSSFRQSPPPTSSQTARRRASRSLAALASTSWRKPKLEPDLLPPQPPPLEASAWSKRRALGQFIWAKSPRTLPSHLDRTLFPLPPSPEKHTILEYFSPVR